MQSRSSDDTRGAWVGIVIAGVASVSGWLPPLASGGLLLLLVGIAMVVFPGPRRISPWLVVPFWVLALAPLLVLGAGFLELRGVRLPIQQWVIGRWMPVYYAGLLFAWWLAARRWNRDQVDGVVGGTMLVLAVLLVVAVLQWLSAGGRLGAPLSGPFESPNSFGLLMALGGAGCAGLLFGGDRRLRWGWLGGVVFFLVGALLSQSRAGVGFLLIGVLMVFGLRLLPGSGTKRLAAGALLVALGLAGVALALPFMPEEVKRLGEMPTMGESYRVAIQSDAFRMAFERPLTGLGLGNFEAFFPLFQEASASDYRVRHAENDLLHFATEVGVVAAISLMIAIGYVAARILFGRKGMGPIAAVGVACFFLFAAHLFIDQSGHQVGLVAVGLILISSAWPAIPVSSRPWVMRIVGGGAVVASFVWLVFYQSYTFPNPRLDWVRVDQPPPDGAEAWAAARLAVAPLDWRAVEIAAHRELEAGNIEAAKELFARLKTLSPYSTATAEREMRAWMGTDQQELGMDAARRWLRWSESPQREARFLSIFRMNNDPGFAGTIANLGQDDWRLSMLSALQLPDGRDDKAYANLKAALDRANAHAEAFGFLVESWPKEVEPSDLEEMRTLFPDHAEFFRLQALRAKAKAGDLNEATDDLLRIRSGETLPEVVVYSRRNASAVALKIAELLNEGATAAAEAQLKVGEEALDPELRPFFRGWILAIRGRDLEAWSEFDQFIRLRCEVWAVPPGKP